MRRRTPTDAPGHLTVFRLEDWIGEGRTDFERYEKAMHTWLAARRDFEEAAGWDGDPEWWAASHDAIVAMPDEPWDPSRI